MPTVHPIPDTTIAVGSVKSTGAVVKKLGGKRVFLVTDKNLTKAGLTDIVGDVVKQAKLGFVVFDEIMANPTVDIINEGADRLRELMGDTNDAVLVSLGGGSVMDAGKAIAMLAGQPIGSTILDYAFIPALTKGTDNLDFSTMAPKKAPIVSIAVAKIIAIPTTSGTASETNGASVVSDPATHRKVIYVNDCSKAAQIIMDAELTVGCPRYPTATCGMDVLTHALEAYTSVLQGPYSDAIALGAIKLVAQNLAKLVKDLSNIELRANMHVASHMAGVAFNISQLGICHALGHPLSAVYNQAHGQTLATMLPHIMEFNLEARKDKYAEVAKAFGVYQKGASDEANARHAIRAISSLSIEVGTARSIRDMGGSEKDFPMLIGQALTDLTMLTTARKPTSAECHSLYAAAMDNEQLYPGSKL